MESKTIEFILGAIYCHTTNDISFIDGILKDFNIRSISNALDMDDFADEITEAVRINREFMKVSPLNKLIEHIYDHIIKEALEHYSDEYDLKEDDFSYYINSVGSHLYLFNEVVHTWEDIEESLKKLEPIEQ